MDPLNIMRARLLMAHQAGLFQQHQAQANMGLQGMYMHLQQGQFNPQLMSNMPRQASAIQGLLMPQHLPQSPTGSAHPMHRTPPIFNRGPGGPMPGLGAR